MDDIAGKGRAAAKGGLKDEICSGVMDEHPTIFGSETNQGLRTIWKSEPAHDQRSAAHSTHATQEPMTLSNLTGGMTTRPQSDRLAAREQHGRSR